MKILPGILHEIPKSLVKVLQKKKKILTQWNDLTPVARNEWICFITIPKKEETKAKRLKRLSEDLSNGKKRPCCWPGCPHRRPSAKKWFT